MRDGGGARRGFVVVGDSRAARSADARARRRRCDREKVHRG
jgi:hypothetical protein